ncbi:MAG: HigA family addiction module antidote protein [Bryobacteraceae bacterium]|nr:HigA family addiction module antidote protein [Bryobacteraceae bacterium]
MEGRTYAEVFPPGETVREELEERGWTQVDLAEILGRPPRLVNELIAGKRSITPDTARELGEAFGTEAKYWLNLEAAYQLWRSKRPDNAIGRRARLYTKAPVKDLIRRRWIEPSSDIDLLEKRVCSFLGISSLDEDVVVWPHAARKTTPYGDISPAQVAWLCRAKRLAEDLRIERFSDDRFDEALTRLRALLSDPAKVREVPAVLANAGIRFVVLEHLPQSRIDGACLWLDEHSPIVAISVRFDRIDWFWHTVLHELFHVKNRDGLDANQPLDTNLVGDKATRFEDKPAFERRADESAADFLVQRTKLTDFMARVRPLYAKWKIQQFAHQMGVHPGIVVGQLQFRDEIKYYHNREMLVKIRDEITSTAVTDGWGHIPA